ncbi:MAG: polyprenyl synthetase family protein, partial [Pseudomonadota bacterium]
LMNVNDPETTEDSYREVIYRKTAKLFEAGGQIAAVLADAAKPVERALQDYGRNLGTAFQLVDDALDFAASPEELGKNIGDDLAEGKPTLPMIFALQKADPAGQELLKTAILEGSVDRLDDIQQIIEATGALKYTADRAQEAADLAISALNAVPDSDYKQALVAIADFSVQRRS